MVIIFGNMKIKIKYYTPIINFSDNQTRIVKNIPTIKWINKVHERLDGFKTYSTLPPQDEFCLLHPRF